MRPFHYRLIVASVAALLTVSACGPGAHVEAEALETIAVASQAQPVVREILGQVEDPPGAPNRRLTLVRYTIAPGAELAPHVHPGIQMGSVVSGTLSYRVVSGTAIVHRSVDPTGLPAAVEELVGPAETKLSTGDTILEEDPMVHFGANRTTEPVVILAALITEAGADLAVPVSDAAAE